MPARVNPLYIVMRALNFGERLSKKDEANLGSDPRACLLYARLVLKGRLPDHLHNRMILGIWEDKDDLQAVREYLELTGNAQAV